jgi:uncharacterized membrane protein
MAEDRNGSAEVAAVAAERLAFFSDAVVAIAITLLAIELPVPEGVGAAELWEAMTDDAAEYLGFLISFLVIANHWVLHHRVFRWVRRADYPVVQLNFLWLLFIVVNPYLTRLITEEELDVLRFGLYAGAQALQACTFGVMIAVLARKGWFASGTPESLTRRGWVRSVVAAAGFVLSMPLYLLIGSWAFAVWVLVPVISDRVMLRTGAIAAQ